MRYILGSFLIWTFWVNYVTVTTNRNPLNVYLALPLEDKAFTLQDLIKATAERKHLTPLPMDIQINRFPADVSSQESFAEKYDKEKNAYENEIVMRTSLKEGDEGFEGKIQKAVESFVVNKTMSVLGKLSETMNTMQNSFNVSSLGLHTMRDTNRVIPDRKLVFNIVVNRKPSDEKYDSNEDTNQQALRDWNKYLKSFEQKKKKTPQPKFDTDVERLLSKMVRLRSSQLESDETLTT